MILIDACSIRLEEVESSFKLDEATPAKIRSSTSLDSTVQNCAWWHGASWLAMQGIYSIISIRMPLKLASATSQTNPYASHFVSEPHSHCVLHIKRGWVLQFGPTGIHPIPKT